MKEQEIKDIANSFRTFDNMYDDLIEYGPETLPYCLDNDGVWKRIEMDWIFEAFEKDEEYEKCAEIYALKKEGHYIAPPEKQKELNDNMPDYYKDLFTA